MHAFVALVLLAVSVAAANVVPITPVLGKADVVVSKPGIIAYTSQDHVIPAAKAIQYTSPVVASIPVPHPNTYVAGVHPTTYIGGPHPVAYVSGVQPSAYAHPYAHPYAHTYAHPYEHPYAHPYLQQDYVPGVQPLVYAAQHAYVPGVQAYVPGHHTNYVAAVQPN